MKKILSVSLLTLMLCSCGGQKELYSWGNYDKTSYNYLKNADEDSQQELMKNYQEIINGPKKGKKNIPPGVCADYGYLLVKQGKVGKGKEMLKKEIALYPESKIFIDRILKMIDE